MENISLTSPGAPGAPGRAGFATWLEGETGAVLAAYERQQLDRILPDLFGYYAVQIGYFATGALDSARRVRNKFELRLDADGVRGQPCAALGGAVALPFAAHSIDVVLLPHVLEYAAQPNAVLAEIERVLIEDGWLIVAGFNPWSLWGLPRLLPRRRKQPPWDGRFYSATNIRRRLATLGFEVIETDRLLVRLTHPRRAGRSLSPQQQGARSLRLFDTAYILVAQKRRAPVTPVKLKWHKGLSLSGASAGPATMAEPENSCRVRQDRRHA